jgi:hypothetical protein
MKPPMLKALLELLPIDAAVRIELIEGVPIFRAPPHVQERIEELLARRQTAALDAEEVRELMQYEELDEFLGLVNRLMRNEVLTAETANVSAA